MWLQKIGGCLKDETAIFNFSSWVFACIVWGIHQLGWPVFENLIFWLKVIAFVFHILANYDPSRILWLNCEGLFPICPWCLCLKLRSREGIWYLPTRECFSSCSRGTGHDLCPIEQFHPYFYWKIPLLIVDSCKGNVRGRASAGIFSLYYFCVSWQFYWCRVVVWRQVLNISGFSWKEFIWWNPSPETVGSGFWRRRWVWEGRVGLICEVVSMWVGIIFELFFCHF